MLGIKVPRDTTIDVDGKKVYLLDVIERLDIFISRAGNDLILKFPHYVFRHLMGMSKVSMTVDIILHLP